VASKLKDVSKPTRKRAARGHAKGGSSGSAGKNGAKPRARRAATSTTEQAAEAVREKILTGFSSRARRSGIRGVLMGELATDLRMSAMTLYKHFSSKDELVTAMVDAWALELAAIDALDWDNVKSCASALEVLLAWADAWTESLASVSPAFFRDLRRDHPEAWERFNAVIDERKRVAGKHLRPYLREDLPQTAVFSMLDELVVRAADPRYADMLGLSRRETVRAALSIWGGGALRQRTKLRSV